jgi:CRP/FNR family transcriptional regulator
VQIRNLSQAQGVAPDGGHTCSNCPEGDHCLPVGLGENERRRLDEIMRVSHTIRPRQTVFSDGDPFQGLYAVRSGVFKTLTRDIEGGERVVGFHLPGELIGMDGVYSGRHHCEGVAVRTGRVCRFPYSELTAVASRTPGLTTRLLQLFSKDIAGNLATSSECLADERLAAFLLSMAWRMPPRGELSERITLPMSRLDIASHLGVAAATLSRLLARLQEDGLISVRGQQLQLRDPAALRHRARRLCPAS